MSMLEDSHAGGSSWWRMILLEDPHAGWWSCGRILMLEDDHAGGWLCWRSIMMEERKTNNHRPTIEDQWLKAHDLRANTKGRRATCQHTKGPHGKITYRACIGSWSPTISRTKATTREYLYEVELRLHDLIQSTSNVCHKMYCIECILQMYQMCCSMCITPADVFFTADVCFAHGCFLCW